jgi:uncharacterized protein DUF4350
MTARRVWIVIAVVVGGLVVLNLVAAGVDRAVGGNQPAGTPGSSYATAPEGLAAFRTLLTRFGHDVNVQRGTVADQRLDPNTTVFVIEPNELTADDAAALLDFVAAGGRLVIGGRTPFYLHNLRDDPPRWQFDGDTSWTEIDPSFVGVREIQGAGEGSWASPGTSTVLVGSADRSLLTQEHVGAGEIAFLADASPLENGYLATADNAAFALALAGDTGRPVVFAEGVHGFDAHRGFSAVPGAWKLALVLLAVAALAFVWSRARRFGPPDRTARELPPARAEYVDALSVSLERTRSPAAALGPAQHWAQERLASRAGLGPAPGDQAIARAARAFGCSDEEIASLLHPVAEPEDVLALGRAVARIGGQPGGRVS